MLVMQTACAADRTTSWAQTYQFLVGPQDFLCLSHWIRLLRCEQDVSCQHCVHQASHSKHILGHEVNDLGRIVPFTQALQELCAGTIQVKPDVRGPLTAGACKHMLPVSWHVTPGNLHAAMTHMPCTVVGMPAIGSQAWQQSTQSSSARIGV